MAGLRHSTRPRLHVIHGRRQSFRQQLDDLVTIHRILKGRPLTPVEVRQLRERLREQEWFDSAASEFIREQFKVLEGGKTA